MRRKKSSVQQELLGLKNVRILSVVHSAMCRILKRLNSNPSPPDLSLTTHERNFTIRARYAAGVS